MLAMTKHLDGAEKTLHINSFEGILSVSGVVSDHGANCDVKSLCCAVVLATSPFYLLCDSLGEAETHGQVSLTRGARSQEDGYAFVACHVENSAMRLRGRYRPSAKHLPPRAPSDSPPPPGSP